jgi:hypothetical protein
MNPGTSGISGYAEQGSRSIFSFALSGKRFALLVVALGAVSLFAMYRAEFVLLHDDVSLYAEPARNIIEGRGLSTDIRWPMELPFLPRIDGKPARLYASYLGQPFFLWIPLKAFGLIDASILAFSSAFFLLTLLPLFILTKKFFGAVAARAACVIYVLYPPFVRVGYAGFSQVPFVFLALCGTVFLLGDNERAWKSLVPASVLFSMAGYFREEVYLLLVAGAIFLYLSRDGLSRWIRIAVIFAIFGLMNIPRYLYFYRHFGALGPPYGAANLYNFWSPFDNWIIQNIIDFPPLGEMLRSHSPDFARRTVLLLGQSLKYLFFDCGLLIAAAVPGVMSLWKKRDARKYYIPACVLIALNFLLYGVVVPLERYFHMIGVYLLPFAAYGIVVVAGRLREWKPRAPILFVLFIALLLPTVLSLANTERPAENSFKRETTLRAMDRLGRAAPEGAVLMTDIAPTLAWYTRHPTIALPRDLLITARLSAFGVSDDYFALSNWYYMRRSLFDPAYEKSYFDHVALDGRPYRGCFQGEAFRVCLYGPKSVGN